MHSQNCMFQSLDRSIIITDIRVSTKRVAFIPTQSCTEQSRLGSGEPISSGSDDLIKLIASETAVTKSASAELTLPSPVTRITPPVAEEFRPFDRGAVWGPDWSGFGRSTRRGARGFASGEGGERRWWNWLGCRGTARDPESQCSARQRQGTVASLG